MKIFWSDLRSWYFQILLVNIQKARNSKVHSLLCTSVLQNVWCWRPKIRAEEVDSLFWGCYSNYFLCGIKWLWLGLGWRWGNGKYLNAGEGNSCWIELNKFEKKAINTSFRLLLLYKIYGFCVKGLKEMVIEFMFSGFKVFCRILRRNTMRQVFFSATPFHVLKDT